MKTMLPRATWPWILFATAIVAAPGCAAWRTWRNGGRDPDAPAAAASVPACVCPVTDAVKPGQSSEVAFDLVVERATPDGFVGRCPDPDCACDPIAVHLRAAPQPAAEAGGVRHVAGRLTRTASGLELQAIAP